MRQVPYHASQPIVISGPSGVGKGTLITRLCESHPKTFSTVVSHTTRPPRPGETQGVHYHFTTETEFQNLYAQGIFIECTVYNGHHYGTSFHAIGDVMERGMVPLLDIDMEGVKAIKKFEKMSARYVFIAPLNLDVLETRLRGRGTEDEDTVQKRLEQATLELDYAAKPGTHDLIIVNDDLTTALKDLEAFALSTEPLPPKKKTLREKVETWFEVKLRWLH
ncbi:guanylate kinase [Fusarium sporotrichioides]|uniref:guanylate kinase n=1 Tax=Fusarium sporotrichioides TaxID=5514 RepID=A0A395REY5_FUSSP|nr:guanylate kinase [Fusarium sporotrichioides]